MVVLSVFPQGKLYFSASNLSSWVCSYVGSLFTSEEKKRRVAHDVTYLLLLCMSTLITPQTQNARHETKMTMLTLVYKSAILRSVFNN